MCRKAGQKQRTLLRLSPYPDTTKRKTKYTTTVKPQLNYCPLVWMFCPRKSNNLIKKVQERALRITYNDQLTDFKSLLSNHNEITIHQRNLQVLMTEIYKIINHIAPPIMSSLFEIRENTHNTRYFQVLSNESRRTVNYGLETICYRAPFLWANLPPEYKLANSLNIFKRKIKTWKEKIVHVGYAKHTLEKWATFSFPRSRSISGTLFFFFLYTIQKLSTLNRSQKKLKK